MDRRRPFWLLCLLMLSVFCQGIAAAGMLVCGTPVGSAQRQATTQAFAPAHDCHQQAPGANPAPADPHHAHPLPTGDTPAGLSAPAADPSDNENDALPDVVADGCSVCAACCLGSALPITSLLPSLGSGAADEPAAPGLPRVSFLSEGLERPPRS